MLLVLVPVSAMASGWSIVSSPNNNGSGTQSNTLAGVTCMSASVCWAVGDYVNGSGYHQTLIEQWASGTWSIVASPNTFSTENNSLTSVTCPSAVQCWAVGSYTLSTSPFNTQTLIEEWTGGSWSIVSSPNNNGSGTQANSLASVSCAGTSECWAAGTFGQGNNSYYQTLVELWNGSSWAIVSSPSIANQSNYLRGVTCWSGTECWAVGGNTTTNAGDQSLTEQWNGSAWSMATAPSESSAFLNGVTCASASECWAVGHYFDGIHGNPVPLIEEWNGSFWATLTAPAGGAYANDLTGVACVSPSECHAVGQFNPGVTPQTLVETWDGNAWTVVSSADTSPSQANGLAGIAVASPTDWWAVGGYTTGGGSTQTLIEEHAVSRGTYVAVAPYRVLDTRPSGCVQCGGGALGPNTARTVQVTGTINGGTVPANAIAVAVNLTGTNGTANTFLQLSPAGQGGLGTTSNLNLAAHSTQANLDIVPLGSGGQVTLYNRGGSVDAILDVAGYFLPSPNAASAGTPGTFHPIPPLRMCDTRANQNTQCALTTSAPLGAGERRAITFWGPPNGSSTAPQVPTNGSAAAVVFNLTGTDGTADTYLTAYPTGVTHVCGAPPTSSNVNLRAHGVQPNRVIVPIDLTNGKVCIYNRAGSTDVVIDVNGWFGTGGEASPGALYYPAPPVRLCDTRASQPANQCTGKTIGPQGTLQHVNLAGTESMGAPAAPVAVVTNATGTAATGNTYITVYPDGTVKPLASDLNVLPGANVAVLDLVQLGGGGGVNAYNQSGQIDLIFDVEGWFQ